MNAAAQNSGITKEHYIIYSTEKEKKINLKTIVKEFKDYDVIFFGEEHDDSVGHYLQDQLFQALYGKYGDKMAISFEQFDRDVQYIIDEYLDGIIKESYFNKDSRQWKNYKDYKPMVEFSKENNLDVIAANAPFRYVNVASKNGQEGLLKLSDKAKTAIAPLPYKTADGAYLDKLVQMMMEHMTSPEPDSTATDSVATDTITEVTEAVEMVAADTVAADTTAKMPSYAMNMSWDGQSLWDATMAYSISEYLKKKPGQKVMHLNGRFHSDEYFGIVQQLKIYSPNTKVLVISSGRDDAFPKVDFAEHKKMWDYVIITDPEVPKSY